jgi:hypothetical protein
MPNAVRNASRCGCGRRPTRSSIGAHSWCSPAKASSISGCTPSALHPAARRLPGQKHQQCRLAHHPGFAVHDQGPALTGPHGLKEPAERGTLGAAARLLRRTPRIRKTAGTGTVPTLSPYRGIGW